MDIRTIFYWNYIFPVETVTACPVQMRAHHHIAVYIDSNDACNQLCG